MKGRARLAVVGALIALGAASVIAAWVRKDVKGLAEPYEPQNIGLVPVMLGAGALVAQAAMPVASKIGKVVG